MIDKKIKTRIAFIYSPCETLTKDYFFTISYHFFMTALKRHPEIDICYICVNNTFDVLDLKGKVDVILLFENRIHCVPKKLINIKKSGIPVIVRVGDLHISKIYDTDGFHDEFNVSAYFGYQHSKIFYNYFPKNYSYEVVLYGLEPSLYQNLTPFSDRISNKILNSGATGKTKIFSKVINRVRNPFLNPLYHYKLRTKCNELDYVDYTPTLQHEYVGDKYPLLLEKYMASIAATSLNYTTKYFEIPAAGCLSFMEVNDENGAEKLGFKDFHNSIFINEKNYKKKFDEFLETSDDPKWEKIAKSGYEHVMENLTNDNAVESLLKLIKRIIS